MDTNRRGNKVFSRLAVEKSVCTSNFALEPGKQMGSNGNLGSFQKLPTVFLPKKRAGNGLYEACFNSLRLGKHFPG